MSKLLRKNSRKFSAATLIACAVILLMFVFVDHSRSANPTNGTIGPAGPNVTWVGTAAGGTSQLSEDSCVEGVSCDTFLLTISGTPGDWAGKKVRVDFSWIDPANDYDVYIHKGDNNGPIAGSSTNTHLSGNTERIDAHLLAGPVARCSRNREQKCDAADRKSTRLNSSHGYSSYAVFCLKKKRPHPRLPLSE